MVMTMVDLVAVDIAGGRRDRAARYVARRRVLYRRLKKVILADLTALGVSC